jgi:hypothetical protein
MLIQIEVYLYEAWKLDRNPETRWIARLYRDLAAEMIESLVC